MFTSQFTEIKQFSQFLHVLVYEYFNDMIFGRFLYETFTESSTEMVEQYIQSYHFLTPVWIFRNHIKDNIIINHPKTERKSNLQNSSLILLYKCFL